ncbi:hypothetical protein [Pseudomonas sp.]|uniref:hypothetical protein n=2 Tax=Pseudomonas TaxID=286 RepID=UPI003BAEF6D6
MKANVASKPDPISRWWKSSCSATPPGATTSPATTITKAFEDGFNDMILWWKERQATRVEAEALADYLIAHQEDKVIKNRQQDVPLRVLPPETIGPMVYLLTEGVAAGVTGMFIENQEQALVILLS